MRFRFLFIFVAMIGVSSIYAQANAPRIFYFCGQCDQAQMAGTEGEINAAAKQSGTSVLKLGDGYGDYSNWAASHPEDGPYGLTEMKPLFESEETKPKTPKDIEAARQKWMGQIYDQLVKMDKTRPIVLHMGNHGENLHGGDPAGGTFRCYNYDQYTPICITYKDLGDMMEKAGLTKPNSPPVRVIGDHCFGGSAHYLSTRFPNVCSASVVSSKTAQNSTASPKYSEGQLNFGSAFWRAEVQHEGSDHSKISMADAFNSAWSTVPSSKDDAKFAPGGMLSSTYYVNQVLGIKDESKGEELKLTDLSKLEKSIYELNDIMFSNQEKKKGTSTGGDYVKSKPSACLTIPPPADPNFIKNCQRILVKLGLASGMNSYKEALDKMNDPVWANAKKQNLVNLKNCWANAQSSYDHTSADQKAYLEKSRWSEEFFWDVGKTIDQKKYQYSGVKDQQKMDLVNVTLNACVKKNAAGARDYLVQLTNLKRLQNLEEFARQSTPEQKDNFRKKVECESAPLL